MAHRFAAWSRVRRSKQPAACARKVLLTTYPNTRPRMGFPGRRACHRSWNCTLVPSSGDDLRPWWPPAWYLPRPTRSTFPPRNSQWPRRRLLLPIERRMIQKGNRGHGQQGWRGRQARRAVSRPRMARTGFPEGLGLPVGVASVATQGADVGQHALLRPAADRLW
jgi:hypothetical protein